MVTEKNFREFVKLKNLVLLLLTLIVLLLLLLLLLLTLIVSYTSTDPEINQGGGWLTFQVGSLIYVVTVSITIAAKFKDMKWYI